MNVPYLRQLAFERFINLLLNRSAGDTRTPEQLRQIAARQVVQEARREARINKSTPNNPNASGFDLLFAKIWRVCQNMQAHAEMRRKSQATPKPEITIDCNPVIVNEPFENVVQFPKPAPLLSTSLRTAELLPEHEFPRLGGMADEVTSNWKASIQQNQQIAKEREAASARHRSQQCRVRSI
jgi:hypothetical protein